MTLVGGFAAATLLLMSQLPSIQFQSWPKVDATVVRYDVVDDHERPLGKQAVLAYQVHGKRTLGRGALLAHDSPEALSGAPVVVAFNPDQPSQVTTALEGKLARDTYLPGVAACAAIVFAGVMLTRSRPSARSGTATVAPGTRVLAWRAARSERRSL